MIPRITKQATLPALLAASAGAQEDCRTGRHAFRLYAQARHRLVRPVSPGHHRPARPRHRCPRRTAQRRGHDLTQARPPLSNLAEWSTRGGIRRRGRFRGESAQCRHRHHRGPHPTRPYVEPLPGIARGRSARVPRQYRLRGSSSSGGMASSSPMDGRIRARRPISGWAPNSTSAASV